MINEESFNKFIDRFYHIDFEKRYDIRWTCPGCGNVSYSNKGYAVRQCECNNISPYMNKEYTNKGLKSLKKGEVR